MIEILPLEKIPNQKFLIDLNGQECEIELLYRDGFTFMNMSKSDNVVFNGFICHNKQNIIAYNHLGFNGELMFVDTQGSQDPNYEGFNDRWFLVYVHD